jgi:putative salt-induced outer membrane protein YdiY
MRIKFRPATLTLCLITAISTPLAAEESGWKNEVEAGINGSSGNSDAFSLHAGYTATYKDTEDGWKFATAYDKAESDGTESRNQFIANLQKDWFWSGSPWFSFAQGRYDWDKFKEWDYRLSASGGAGYEFINDDTWYLTGRFGLGGNKTFGDQAEDFTPEAILALNAAWTISERESIELVNTLYPNLEDGGEYRNLTDFSWKMQMTDKGSLAMKIGLINEYDSLAAQGTDKNDFKYSLSLVWGL